MSRGKNLPAPMPKVDLLAKNWFIIKTRFLRVPPGTLVNLATEYGLVYPLGTVSILIWSRF